MAEQKRYRHIFLKDTHHTTHFTSPQGGSSKINLPPRSREPHSQKLRRALDVAWRQARQLSQHRKAIAHPTRDGVYLEFQGKAGYDLVTKSLEDRRSKIRLLNVREQKDEVAQESTTYATVYIPANKRKTFLNKIKEYATKVTPKKGEFKNKPLVEGIEDLRLAVLESFWRSDGMELIPGETAAAWCEVWLLQENEDTEQQFRSLAQQLDIECDEGALQFPERTVILTKANRGQLMALIEASPHIAEFRRAKETALFWTELPNAEQTEWVKELLNRLSIDETTKVSVCVLDTGVNNGHELLQPILSDDDCQTYHPDWGSHDHNSHGTLMCGVAAYGDLQKALESYHPVTLTHRLESVKILPSGDNQNDPKLYGEITQQATSLAEIQAPERSRILCMAVTAKDNRDRGRPSSWSAAIDALTSGYNDPKGEKRLFIVCAGNVDHPDDWKDYPESNLTDSIHDPAQSWNALVVGAYTEKTRLTEEDLKDHQAIAPNGGLSPFSTTSYIWENRKWPAKPDIVLEGGNAAKSSEENATECDDLSLLSTFYRPTIRQFSPFNMTSAATAQAAWMAAQIQAVYPQAWPETTRGLLVHSADWTDQMKQDFLEHPHKCVKGEYADLIRICGYGVPDLNRARECVTNSLTLISQETLQPFEKHKSRIRTKDMHIHEIPWPVDVLRGLGETEIKLRITLSYFVEPGPGEVGWKDRYRYPSHALRFRMILPTEEKDEFVKKLNAAAREDGEELDSSDRSKRWTIGPNGRDLGSIHSDIWVGTAAEIAACNLIGIYPVTGWWKERSHLGNWNKTARYSLIVSISTPEQTIDLYTPVAVRLKIPIETR